MAPSISTQFAEHLCALEGEQILGGTPGSRRSSKGLVGLLNSRATFSAEGQIEGRRRAKARGIKFGTKLKLTKYQREEALARKRNGETLTAIAKSYNVSHMTIVGYRYE